MSEQLRWAPAWFSDPTGRHDHRWWDGAAWTEHVADGGVAGRDPLDLAPGEATFELPSTRTTDVRGVAQWSAAAPGARTPDAMPTVALVIAIVALLLSPVPFLGLALAVTGLTLGLVALRRSRRHRTPRPGAATGAVVTASFALVIALVMSVTAVALLRASDGALTEAFRGYVECLETRSQAECRVVLEEMLERSLR